MQNQSINQSTPLVKLLFNNPMNSNMSNNRSNVSIDQLSSNKPPTKLKKSIKKINLLEFIL